MKEFKDKKEVPDIFLVISPPWGIEDPPLGLACLSTYLKIRGFKPEVFDFNIYMYDNANQSYKYLWEMGSANDWRGKGASNEIFSIFKKEIDYCVEKIVSSGAEIVGFSMLSNSQDLITAKIIKEVKTKRPNIKIILGGISISVSEQRAFFEAKGNNLIDAYIIGEGEESLCQLLQAIKSAQSLEGIQGVLIYKDDNVIHSPRILKENLDEFPFPTFEEFDFNMYLNKGNSLAMEWSRGCIGHCSFCAFKTSSYMFRKKCPELIVKTVEYYIKKYKTNHFSLVDSAINGDLKYLEEICNLLIRYKLNVKFSALAIPRRDMSKRLLGIMKEAGFIRIEYGVESGSDKVLKEMKKVYASRDVENIIKATHETGIATVIYLIIGFPGEGEVEFAETIEFLKSNSEYIDLVKSINPLYLMAGSHIYKHHKHYGITLPAVDSDIKWFIGRENTYKIRVERVNKIRYLLKEIGVKYHSKDNQFEREVSFSQVSSDRTLDFLLVNLPPWSQENPHIGIGFLSSYLRSKSVALKVLDLNKAFFINNPDFRMLWHVENKNFWSNKDTFPLILEIFQKDIEKSVEDILSFDCAVLGFSVVDPKEKLTIEFIERIKEKSPDKKIILGGPATSTPEQRKIFLDAAGEDIDVFVVGEGEETLFYLLEMFLRKKDIKITGECYIKNNGRWVHRGVRPMIALDGIPFPTYEEFDLNLYGKSLLVEWSRGCKGRCAFCKNYRLFSMYRFKPADCIVQELKYHKEKYNICEFTVTDSILNGDLENLNQVCNKVILDNLKIKWTGQIAPHKYMGFDFFKKMKEAGCFKLQIGLESGSNRVLRSMRKTFTAEISEMNIRFAKKAGIETEIFVMVGFPSETERDFKETYNFIRRNSNYIDTIKSINTLHLIAGTDIYENREKYGIKPLPEKDWHYLWETYDGNIYNLRKEKTQRLLDLSNDLGLKVMEANIQEGKENIVETIIGKQDLKEKILILKESVNSLQRLPQKRMITRRSRKLSRWLILIFLCFYTFFYIIYFWIYMKLRNKVLLGGRRK
ncbi:MAG: B12-binding domain-containing radical SAM protein [Candidatus Omnitrophica bacterium]|nr:B12-binding domain-containing radical SAM protein [Candidatus Omnitrophota bacterium]MBU1853429.1 B12-binding domain-containing radical SAM protein [Candidatus Omnitrophota bacterium]